MKADRIYIFVPRTLTTAKGGHVRMKCGRMAAQCAHVSAVLETMFPGVHGMTTIVLQVPNSKELAFVAFDCLFVHKIPVKFQYDTLPGSRKTILQAVATVPITKKQARDLNAFKLWSCSKQV